MYAEDTVTKAADLDEFRDAVAHIVHSQQVCNNQLARTSRLHAAVRVLHGVHGVTRTLSQSDVIVVSNTCERICTCKLQH
jgi:phosphoglycerate dehydrogenase-like enzyme